eukprot:TRINITY_DN1957_c0_g3_i2.p1 TRINITY_DN1957_c0_g3~~TRINITY_DN1957_c0_g3_i2.p1  ORF type:complete len:188 (+),score=28.94 TRINITY_DN1957_c0_g3_i2:451-1014(+)
MHKVMMPQRSFSPRSFMGDRGFRVDNLGRVLRSDSICVIDVEDKIVAPRPFKPNPQQNPYFYQPYPPANYPASCYTPTLPLITPSTTPTPISPIVKPLPSIRLQSSSPTPSDNKLEEWEASREIQTIILQSLTNTTRSLLLDDPSSSPAMPPSRNINNHSQASPHNSAHTLLGESTSTFPHGFSLNT